jgi:ApbE superfamily uncharacterized protein (UPF0280 family)
VRDRSCLGGDLALAGRSLEGPLRAGGPLARMSGVASRRAWTSFRWKEADLRISSSAAGLIVEEVKRLRAELEEYIGRQPEFLTSLAPIQLLPGAPPIAVRMAEAAVACQVGPMAAVAGAVAQMAAEQAIASGADEAIIENGGDTWIASTDEVEIGLYAGDHPLSGRLALRIPPARLPLSVCSSSSRFGHSLSLGDCDLATVVAASGALADAAATLAGNSVRTVDDVDAALRKLMAIDGVIGVLIVQADRVGVAGDLPPLVRCVDPLFPEKTFHADP